MKRHSRSSLISLILTLAFAAGLTTLQAQEEPPPCSSDPSFSYLDFWVGEWNVFVGERLVGENRIEKLLDGCAVAEYWTSASGGSGQSLFYYTPATRAWKQVWVTPYATVPGGVKEKRLVERFDDGGVRFQGTIVTSDTSSYFDRTTLTPISADSVRQQIEVSMDGGANWKTTFDAVYVRK